MILVISQFKVANDLEKEVREAFLTRPRLVDDVLGFLGIEVFTDTEDSSVFYLVTRWTDVRSFHAWHGSEAHHQSHRGIPKGLKLAAGFTHVTYLERLDASAQHVDFENVAADSVPALARFLADSSSVHMLLAARDGTIRLCNAAMASHLKITPADAVTRVVWDLVTEQDTQSLQRRLGVGRNRLPNRFLLNFVDINHSPFTLECRLEIQPNYFLLLGEAPDRANDAMHEEMLRLNNDLSVLTREHVRRGRELERALDELNATNWHLKKIQEVLPICMECGKVKTASKWEDVTTYLKDHAPFLSHGYCPICLEKLKAEWGLSPKE